MQLDAPKKLIPLKSKQPNGKPLKIFSMPQPLSTKQEVTLVSTNLTAFHAQS